jgi:hypothetical protein
LAAGTGLRISECLGLQWQDVSFAEAVIQVRRTWTCGKAGWPKSKTSRPGAAASFASRGEAARKATFSEEIALVQNADCSFLPGFRFRGENHRFVLAGGLATDEARGDTKASHWSREGADIVYRSGAGGVSSPHPKFWGENPFFVELEFQYSMSRRSFERVLPNKRSWKIFPASVSET